MKRACGPFSLVGAEDGRFERGGERLRSTQCGHQGKGNAGFRGSFVPMQVSGFSDYPFDLTEISRG